MAPQSEKVIGPDAAGIIIAFLELFKDNGTMNADAPNILEAALNLSDSDRAAIAFQLLGSLKPPRVFDAEDSQLHSEISQRLSAYDSGTSQAATLDEMDSRIRAAISPGKSS